jgi:hypothetical protein
VHHAIVNVGIAIVDDGKDVRVAARRKNVSAVKRVKKKKKKQINFFCLRLFTPVSEPVLAFTRPPVPTNRFRSVPLSPPTGR